jgi:hypothetical protein
MLFAVYEFAHEDLVRNHTRRHDHKIEVLLIKIVEGRRAHVEVRLQEQQGTGEEGVAGIKDKFFVPALYINGQRIKDHEQQNTRNGIGKHIQHVVAVPLLYAPLLQVVVHYNAGQQ